MASQDEIDQFRREALALQIPASVVDIMLDRGLVPFGKNYLQATLGWDCEAYGPEGRGFDALCFFARPGERSCADPDQCHEKMTAERQRIFDRIMEQAAKGDPTAAYLAREFTDPSQLLGGGA